jgi:hypothetical protein
MVKPKESRLLAPLVLPGYQYQLGAKAPGQISELAALTENSFDNGRAVFCALSLAGDYWKRGNSGAKYILSGMLNLALAERTVEVISDTTIEVTTASKENALVVHLLSYHSERRPGNPPIVERIPIVRDIELRVSLEQQPLRVLQQPEERTLQWECRDGKLHTVIPDMHIHTAIMIEK